MLLGLQNERNFFQTARNVFFFNLTDPNSWYYLLSPLKICIEIIPLSYLTDFKSVWIYILCSSANTFNTFNLNWEDFTWNWLRSNYSIHMVVIYVHRNHFYGFSGNKKYYVRITFCSDLICNKILMVRNSYVWGSNF